MGNRKDPNIIIEEMVRINKQAVNNAKHNKELAVSLMVKSQTYLLEYLLEANTNPRNIDYNGYSNKAMDRAYKEVYG